MTTYLTSERGRPTFEKMGFLTIYHPLRSSYGVEARGPPEASQVVAEGDVFAILQVVCTTI